MVCLFRMRMFLRTFFSKLSYSYIKREDNKIAHYLAKLIVNYPNNVIWIKDVSLSVFSFVQTNLTTIF